jgi:ketosteroid isomerase-like protein
MSNVDTAKSALRAFSHGDLAALKEFHSEDAVYELHGFGAPGRWYSSDEVRPRREVCGRDAIVDMFVQLPDYWSTVITEPSEYIDGDEYVGVLGTRCFANNKGSEEFPFVLVLRFDCAGKVVRAEFHADNANWPPARPNITTSSPTPTGPHAFRHRLRGKDVQRRGDRGPGSSRPAAEDVQPIHTG